MNIPFTLIMMFCGTAHLVATTVTAVFAHKRVQYVSLAWILGLITVGMFTCLGLFYTYEQTIDVGLIHPSIVLPLLASAFIETLYPLSLVMPGFLQWHRSVKYAMPAIVVIVGYFTAVMIMGNAPVLHTFSDISDNLLLLPDVFIRVVALLLSVYYIIGLLRLPRTLLKAGTEIPTYMKAYCSWLGITYILFIALSFSFQWWLLYVVLIAVTVNNMTLMLHSLETIAERLPRPHITAVTIAPPVVPVEEEVETHDFNEANLARFRRAEHFMQHSDEWTNSEFTRERLCEQVGFNRHLLLQCLRSQGYNNVHEYITTYRVERLRTIVASHPDDSLTQVCISVGFSTIVTARSAYKKILNRDLDQDWSNRETE